MARPLIVLGVLLALLWCFAGRLLPLGLTLLLSVAKLDPGQRISGFHVPDLSLLHRLEFAHRLVDQLALALGLLVTLALIGLGLRRTLRQTGLLRPGLLFVAIMTIGTSEVLLVPLMSWAQDRIWSLALLERVVPGLLAHPGRHLASGAVLLLLGVAWLTVVLLCWPARADGQPERLGIRLALSCWWCQVWSHGQLVPEWSMRPPQNVELRPWGTVQLLSPVGDWPLMALLALLAWLLVWPAIARVIRTAVNAELWHRLVQPMPASNPSPAGLMTGVLVLVLLLQPWYWAFRAAGATVAFPELADPVVRAGQFKLANLTALWQATFPDAGRLVPALVTLGRALAEAGLAWWAAQGLLRLNGYARGIPAFVILCAVLAWPLAIAVGLSYSAALQQLGVLPWPPLAGALPLLLLMALAAHGGWPARMKADSIVWPAAAADLRRRLLPALIAGAFLVLYHLTIPLLVPPMGHGADYWPVSTAVRVVPVYDPQFPSRIAWLLGWHGPVLLAAGVLTWALLPRTALQPTVAEGDASDA